ncbi:helix-turn-helix transcriptional regulator [Prosthecobacter dejongeii]|uniref:helix-turn-helix transcriptional regulator n=1 Tax=Prosthecobacter dejongeii TaxID=48465 RepID=UPI0038B6692C
MFRQREKSNVAYPPPNQSDPLERQVVLALKAERERQGISANALAQQIGVSRAAITHIEADRSRPTLWLVIRIAQGLGLSLKFGRKRKSDPDIELGE